MLKNHDNEWAGIFPSICTPFAEDGAVDLKAQRDVVQFALACGAHGVVCFGLAGEVNKLTSSERKQLFDLIVEEVDGKVPVLVGVGAEAEHTAIDLTRHAEEAGADGVVIPPPVAGPDAYDALEHYFLSIATNTSLPVVIQNAPAHIGVKLSPELVRRLASKQPNIQYVKIESGPEETAHWTIKLGPSMRMFTGDGGLHLLTCLRAGAVGNIPGVELTDLLVTIYNAEKQGDSATADALHSRLLPYLVFGLQSLSHYNACSKEVLVRRGVIPRGGLRMPAPQLTRLGFELLDKYLQDLDVLGKPSLPLAARSEGQG